MSRIVIELNNITVGYEVDQPPVLNRLNFTVPSGARIGIQGANASGKTTLLHVIMGLRAIQQGEITLYGNRCTTEREFRDARTRIGLLFQDSDDQLFCPTVLDDVAFGPLHLGASPEEAREKARSALTLMALTGYENRITSRLSAGEKKLAALATNLAMSPDTLLLDEPTSFLDETSRTRLIGVLQEFPGTMVIISHDRPFLDTLTRTRYILNQGRLRSDHPDSKTRET